MIFSEITEIPKAIIVPMMPKDAANIVIKQGSVSLSEFYPKDIGIISKRHLLRVIQILANWQRELEP